MWIIDGCRRYPTLFWYAAVIVTTFCADLVFLKLHWANLDPLVDAAHGVITGRPHWIAFQNRLLGPYLILALSQLGIGFEDAWKVFFWLTMLAQNIVLFAAVQAISKSQFHAFSYVVLYSLLFLALQHLWIYPWDMLDNLIFSVFCILVLIQAPAWTFAVLFAVALLNRESALFIAVYLMISSITVGPGARMRAERGRLALGLGLAFVGIAWTKWVRDTLFVETVMGSPDVEHKTFGNHFYLSLNLNDIFVNNLADYHVLYNVLVLTPLLVFGALVPMMTRPERLLYAMTIIVLGNILAFGYFVESRTLLILLPFMIMLWVNLECRIFGRPVREAPAART